jgi:arsenate reductase
VADLYKQGKAYDYVITVCDEAQAGRCPVFPGAGVRLHWGFEDPSGLSGTHQEKMIRIRMIRDAIREKIIGWVAGNEGK